MISVEEAKQIADKTANTIGVLELPLSTASGHYLAEDVFSPIHMPPFRQSAMDGYAVRTDGSMTAFDCITELQAGHSNNLPMEEGEAARIFTGAAVPDDANMVIMQEWVTADAEKHPYKISVDPNKSPKLADHIRPMGEQIKKGEMALKKGSYLNASALGFLQSLGIIKVKVYQKPRFQLIVTGNELSKAGTPLAYGNVYESNSLSLAKAVQNSGFEMAPPLFVKDDLEDIKKTIAQAVTEADIVVLSGGISVGDHDHVGSALTELDCTPHFYKVKQKPGKPLFHGSIDSTTVFALPGNPAASMTCLYEYVLPHARKRSGAIQCGPKTLQLKLDKPYIKRGDRAQFLKALIKGDKVTVLDKQASSMLASLAAADALIFIPEDRSELAEGELVEVHLI